MQRRLHHALREASELRAIFVLIIVLALHGWRRLQRAYNNSTSIIELLENYRRWINVKISYFMYKEVHWI